MNTGSWSYMSYLFVQSVIVHITNYLLLRFFFLLLYEANNLACHRLNNLYSLILFLYSAHPCCSADSQGQGKAWRFASKVQHWALWHFRQAIGWYNPNEIQWQLWEEVCELLPLGAWTAPTLSSVKWPVSLPNGWYGAKLVLQLVIKLCNISESPCQN